MPIVPICHLRPDAASIVHANVVPDYVCRARRPTEGAVPLPDGVLSLSYRGAPSISRPKRYLSPNTVISASSTAHCSSGLR